MSSTNFLVFIQRERCSGTVQCQASIVRKLGLRITLHTGHFLSVQFQFLNLFKREKTTVTVNRDNRVASSVRVPPRFRFKLCGPLPPCTLQSDFGEVQYPNLVPLTGGIDLTKKDISVRLRKLDSALGLALVTRHGGLSVGVKNTPTELKARSQTTSW